MHRAKTLKFTFETEYDLQEDLMQLGIRTLQCSKQTTTMQQHEQSCNFFN